MPVFRYKFKHENGHGDSLIEAANKTAAKKAAEAELRAAETDHFKYEKLTITVDEVINENQE